MKREDLEKTAGDAEVYDRVFYSLVAHRLQMNLFVQRKTGPDMSSIAPWMSKPREASRLLLSRPQVLLPLAAFAILLSLAPFACGQDGALAINTRLLAAARSADGPGLQRALQEGAVVNFRNRIGETPLLIVIKNGHAELVGPLLSAGADINQPAVNGVTPLMAAAYNGQLDIARQLLAKGANFQATDRIRKNAMVYAAGEGHTDIVKLLLDAGVDPNEVYANDLTALMWAAGYGKTETVRALLKAGARADMRDNRGKTALDIAREAHHDDTVTVLEGVTPPA